MCLSHYLRKSMIKILSVVLLATFILFYIQFSVLSDQYLLTQQLKRHQDVLNFKAGNPWQYRILPELILEPFLYVFGTVNGFKIAFAVMVMAVWIALLFYYRALGLSDNVSLFGISILACTFAYSTWDSSLPWSILLDMVFFALGGRMVVLFYKKVSVNGSVQRELQASCGRPLMASMDCSDTIWDKGRTVNRPKNGHYSDVRAPSVHRQLFCVSTILPLTILATLNRETAIFIPIMLLLTDWRDRNVRKVSIITIVCFLVIQGCLRFYMGPQHQIGWYHGIMPFTWQHLQLNLTSLFGWVRFWWFLGAIPILVYLNIQRLNEPLKRWLIWIVPIWFVLHFCGAFIGEPNKYWTLQAIFLLPAVLKIIQGNK